MADAAVVRANEKYKLRAAGFSNLGVALVGAIGVKLYAAITFDRELLIWSVGAVALMLVSERWLTLIESED